jgi:hypothetical protein
VGQAAAVQAQRYDEPAADGELLPPYGGKDPRASGDDDPDSLQPDRSQWRCQRTRRVLRALLLVATAVKASRVSVAGKAWRDDVARQAGHCPIVSFRVPAGGGH